MRRAPNGAGSINGRGYRQIRENGGKQRPEHIVIVERALGHALPDGAEVHHVDENKAHNAGANLVVCPDRTYHRLLHIRAAAFDACGNANYRRCAYCRNYDDPAALEGDGFRLYHRACFLSKMRAAYVARKARA